MSDNDCFCRSQVNYGVIKHVFTINILAQMRIVVLIKATEGHVTVLHRLMTVAILQSVIEFSPLANVKNASCTAQLYMMSRAVVIEVTEINYQVLSGIPNIR